MAENVDLAALEREMGIDPETQKGVDESEANFWVVKNKEGKELSFGSGPDVEASDDDTLVDRAFWTERMEVIRVNFLANKDEQGNPDGTYVSIITLRVLDPHSPNAGKTLDTRVYLNPNDKVRAARTVRRMWAALGQPVPTDGQGQDNIKLGLERLNGKRMKVNLWQGWREKWDRAAQRVIPGDWEPFSPRPADFAKRSAFSKM